MAQGNGETTNYIVPTWVDNASLPNANRPTFPVVNGVSGKTLHAAVSADVDVCNKVVASSWTCFQSWKKSPLAQRRDLLMKFADVLEQRMPELTKTVVEETSCQEQFASFTGASTINILKDLAGCTMGIYGSHVPLAQPGEEGIHGMVFKEAIGPVLLIPPWNAPVILAVRAIGQAVAAGCTVVMKSSELSPKTLLQICDAFKEAGAPPGLLNSLQARREDAAAVTEALISHKHIRKVDFIGSANVGRIIASLAGKHLKPVMLELGGKSPSLVMEDADLAQAAQLCLTGGLMHHGQMCVATERIIVQEKVIEEFRTHLKTVFNAMPGIQGNAINESGAKHAYDIVAEAQKDGHTFLAGEPKMLSPTSVAPAIVVSPKGSRMEDEETFGPSISLYTVKSEQEAIDLANDSAYGWSATIHTRDMDKAIKMARQLDYGLVNCNNLNLFSLSNAPTGGVKGTGWGRSNGMWGIENFLVSKSFTYKAP